jgi:hypothetical protein
MELSRRTVELRELHRPIGLHYIAQQATMKPWRLSHELKRLFPDIKALLGALEAYSGFVMALYPTALASYSGAMKATLTKNMRPLEHCRLTMEL